MGAEGNLVEVGVFVGVGDDVDFEGVVLGVADGEADAVDGDAAFIDGHVAFLCHRFVEGVLEAEGVAALLVYLGYTLSGLIDVTLDNMAV